MPRRLNNMSVNTKPAANPAGFFVSFGSQNGMKQVQLSFAFHGLLMRVFALRPQIAHLIAIWVEGQRCFLKNLLRWVLKNFFKNLPLAGPNIRKG